jgi:hypothetical protein
MPSRPTRSARAARQIRRSFRTRRIVDPGRRHDRLVSQAIRELSSDVEVIVLAQASMARVLDVTPESERIVEILSSPHIAMEQVGRLLST